MTERFSYIDRGFAKTGQCRHSATKPEANVCFVQPVGGSCARLRELARDAAPLRDGVELSRQEARAAGAPHDLAAGGFGQARRSNQHNRVKLKIVFLHHRASDSGEHHFGVNITQRSPADLIDDDEAFLAIHRQTESGATIERQGGMTLLYRVLEVLRIMVLPPHDDDVGKAAGYVQFAISDEAQIAGSQEWPLVAVGEVRLESCRGLRWTAEIAGSNRPPLHPDLADCVRGATPARVGIDDSDPSTNMALPTTAQVLSLLIIPRHWSDLVVQQRTWIDPQRATGLAVVDRRHLQRRLRQTISGRHNVRPQSARREAFEKAADGRLANGLCCVERHLPARQVERRPVVRRYLANANLVGEVRCRRMGATMIGNRLQPAQWPL